MSSSKKLTCKGTLQPVFIRVYRLELYSLPCWYFRPSFVNCCPSNLLSGSTSPPFPVSKYSIHRQCVDGRGWGFCVLLETIFCRSLTLYLTRPRTYKIATVDHTKQKPRREGGSDR